LHAFAATKALASERPNERQEMTDLPDLTRPVPSCGWGMGLARNERITLGEQHQQE